MHNNKKSQMEILGLAIVVVLILVATIFVVRFLVVKAPADYRKGFISNELVSNTLNTFLHTAAKECFQQTMTELLRDCAEGKSITCSNTKDSCEYVQLTANEIFKDTLAKWNIKYEFSAYIDENSPLIKVGESCKSEKKSKIFPIPISSSSMYTKLDIC